MNPNLRQIGIAATAAPSAAMVDCLCNVQQFGTDD